jgi:hypothetical protein
LQCYDFAFCFSQAMTAADERSIDVDPRTVSAMINIITIIR